MGSTPGTTAPPPDPTQSAPTEPKSSFTVERFAAWALPLAAFAILLFGVWQAIVASELSWIVGGVIVYGACLALWLGLSLLRRAQLVSPAPAISVGSPSNRPITATPERPLPVREMISLGQDVLRPLESDSFSEAVVFARYAIWALPYLAVVCLIYANIQAAISQQQRWITTSLLSFAGCVAAWIVHILRPWIERNKPVSQSAAGAPASSLLTQFAAAVLPFLSLIALAGALLAAANASQIKWLTAGALSFCGYLSIVVVVWVRTSYAAGVPQPATPDPTAQPGLIILLQGNWVVRLAMPAMALAALAGDLAMAARFHQLTWITVGLVVFCACMVVWFLQTLGSSQTITAVAPASSTSPPMVPALLLCALLALLGVATYKHEISALEAALLAIPGGLALWFSWIFVGSMTTDGPPQIESNWGGLGGGMGGWRFSASLVYVLCALTFAVCTSFAFLEIHARRTNASAIVFAVLKPSASPSPGGGSAPAASPTKDELSPVSAKPPEK
jgi:hypothetical protein